MKTLKTLTTEARGLVGGEEGLTLLGSPRQQPVSVSALMDRRNALQQRLMKFHLIDYIQFSEDAFMDLRAKSEAKWKDRILRWHGELNRIEKAIQALEDAAENAWKKAER